MKKITSFFLALLLLLPSFAVAVRAEEKDNTIHIKTIEDWNLLAKNCELDKYSKGTEVFLDNDLIFGEDFKSIPYFQGKFDGQGHTISGIKLLRKEKISGVFRITGFDSEIKNLKVRYESDTESERIGFIGYNQGKVDSVSVGVNIKGSDVIGGIAGYNSASGYIENCSSIGKLYGNHYVGGIVGINYGVIKNSLNYSEINNVVNDDLLDLKAITLDSILKSESVASITDLGGIVGENFGTIKNCTNYGTVGYEHVGYNVGGIAGTTIGTIENSNNCGEVYGRKEIGGIAGQMEPAMQLNFSEDYPQKMKRQIKNLSNTVSKTIDHAADYGDENADALYTISDDLREAYDSIEKMLSEGYVLNNGKLEHTDRYYEYRTTLSSSLTDVFDTFDSVATSSSDTSKVLRNDMTSMSNQLRDLGYTGVDFADSLNNPKDMYEDVSDIDNDALKEGKIIACRNEGYVFGDINVGGIAGAMAKENNLDPEDEFSVIGQASFNATYKIKAVVNDCVNTGKIKNKRNNAGGIVGNQDLGLIKNSINYGLIDCEDGNYIGGIVGISISSIKNNYSKCFIKGKDYVGGIAGSAIKLEGNGSLAQILVSESNVGSILGNYGNITSKLVEDEENIKDNWFVYELNAIDGISYENKAYPITLEEMLDLDIDEELKKVNIYFYDEDVLVKKYTMDFADSMPSKEIPTLKEKEFDYGVWGNFELDKVNEVNRDLLIEAEYNNVYPSISSFEEPLAYLLMEGQFSKNDTLTCEEFIDGSLQGEKKQLKPMLEVSDYSIIDKVRIYTFGYKTYDIYELVGNKWNLVDYKKDGSYACFNYNSDSLGYAVVKKTDFMPYIKYGSIALVGFALVQIFVIKKKKLKKNKNK